MTGTSLTAWLTASTLAGAVALGGAAGADAQQTPATTTGPGWQEQFLALDRNGDNRLDPSELRAAQGATFSALDVNNDGVITTDEAAAAGRPGGATGDRWVAGQGTAPGFVPGQGMSGGQMGMPGGRVQETPGPGQGYGMGPGPRHGLGPGPGQGMGPGPGLGMGPGPGQGMGPGPGQGMGPGQGLGPGMMGGSGWMRDGQGFGGMDLDRDGVVSRREFDAHHRTMVDTFDANRDGHVSPDEFADAMPMWRQR